LALPWRHRRHPRRMDEVHRRNGRRHRHQTLQAPLTAITHAVKPVDNQALKRTGASDSELVRTRKMFVGGPGSRHAMLLFFREDFCLQSRRDAQTDTRRSIRISRPPGVAGRLPGENGRGTRTRPGIRIGTSSAPSRTCPCTHSGRAGATASRPAIPRPVSWSPPAPGTSSIGCRHRHHWPRQSERKERRAA
jgi:hypothetical protein